MVNADAIKLYKACRYLRTEIDNKFDKVSFIELLLVLYINQKEMSQTELVPWLDLSQAAISRTIAKLDRMWGLVASFPGDRRIGYQLTDKGKEIVRSFLRIMEPDTLPGPPPTRTRIY